MAKTRLVSFADGRFINRAEAFKESALKSGFCDECTVYRFSDLHESFVRKHSKFIENNTRGYGYWLWKPQVVLEAFADTKHGDLIVYSDVGFSFNAQAHERWLEYTTMTLDSNEQLLSFDNTHTEYKWCKADLMNHLGLTFKSTEMCQSQLAAGLFFIVNNNRNQEIVREWLALSFFNDYHLLDDSPSEIPNHGKFKEHRHDASIFSLLRKLAGTVVTHFEVQGYNYFDCQKEEFPAWALRLTK